MTDSTSTVSKYQEWLDRLPQFARRTAQGNSVMCFKINVNRSGHGYISHMTDDGKIDPVPQPVMNVEQAVRALRDAWAQAQEIANSPQETETTASS